MTNTGRHKRGKVYFVGAGPGAIDLITLRGKNIIDQADCIIYAGSLVNKDMFTDSSAPLYNSAELHLDEIIELMVKTVKEGGLVARVHTGDPALYGAIKEQMQHLDDHGVVYEVVPGVSSAFGASAALSAELTLPEVSQTVIITRRGGRTPVPEKEKLVELAHHGATMMIFLSVGMMQRVVDELREGGYDEETPVAVVKRASWDDEEIISGRLNNISDKIEKAGVTKTAIICVGKVFDKEKIKAASKLYDKRFSHGLRQGTRD